MKATRPAVLALPPIRTGFERTRYGACGTQAGPGAADPRAGVDRRAAPLRPRSVSTAGRNARPADPAQAMFPGREYR